MTFEQKPEGDEGVRRAGCDVEGRGGVEKKGSILYRRRSKYKSEVEDCLMCPRMQGDQCGWNQSVQKWSDKDISEGYHKNSSSL